MKIKLKFLDIISLAFIIFLMILIAHKTKVLTYPFILNFDESIFMAVADLLNHKYIPYKEIWYDHLMGFPSIINLWFKLGLDSLEQVRVLGFMLAIANTILFFILVRLSFSSIASTLSTLILITSLQYLPVSLVVFNDIPSIFFSLLSLLTLYYTAQQNNRNRYLLYILSSALFAFSLHIKLSGVTLIPSILVLIFFSSKSTTKKIMNSVLWLAGAVGFFGLFALTFLPFSYEHVISFHTESSKILGNTGENSAGILKLLKDTFHYSPISFITPIAAIILALFRNQISLILVPLVWLLLNLLRFATVNPVWPSYLVYLSIPAAWLAAFLLNDLLKIITENKLFSPGTKKVNLGFAASFLALTIIVTQGLWDILRVYSNRHPALSVLTEFAAKNLQPHPVEALLIPFQNSGKTIITDHPYYINRFGLKTHPQTAVISRKRQESQNIDGNFLLKYIQESHAELVFLYRFEQKYLESPALVNYLKNNYVEHDFKNKKGRLYISKKLAKES
jgi:hypothetical protein